ncbi:MAG: aminoacyl-tRNA hydrolase [Acidimicrobiales bacterium]
MMVVGLGNPGAEFSHTRHNLGADAVRLVAERHGQRLRTERGTRSEVATLALGGNLVVLSVPQTYMNDSGVAVAALARRYGPVRTDQILVVHDELDLPAGRVKVKVGGGTAGHNGLKSIHAHLHDDGYLRVRIGIGKPPGRKEGTDHVLRAPGRAERDALGVAIETAADAVEEICTAGVASAMQRFNDRAGL